MKPPRFRYHLPTSLEEALDLLAELGADARVLAGGQSLMPLLNVRLAAPAHLIDINDIPELDALDVDAQEIRIRSIVRQRDVERFPEVGRRCPLLVQALRHVGHPIIRNRGTVVGSIAHADPAAELPAVLALLGGTVKAASKRGEREVPAADFFRGHFETSLEDDELITEVRFPALNGRTGASFLEVSRRHGDYALCAAAAIVRDRDARVAFAGVGPVPHVANVSEAMNEGVQAAAGEAVRDLDPPSDIHASAEYRRHLAWVLARRALSEALAGHERAVADAGSRRGEAERRR